MKESNPTEKEFSQEGGQKRVFIEVGPKDRSVPSRGTKEFRGDNIYIGVDVDEEALRKSAWIPGKEEQKISFVAVNARTLPFRENSVDEMFFGNVFGDANTSDLAKEDLLKEAMRTVNAGGKVIILETVTPLGLEEIETLLDERGFKIERIVSASDENWEAEKTLYDNRRARMIGDLHFKPYSGSSYLIYAKKIKVK